MKVRFFEHTYFTDYFSPDPVLVDLGACTGEFTNHFLSMFPSATGFMIEPLPRNFDVITVDERRQKIHGAVVGKETDYVTFFEDNNSTQGGSATVNYFNGTEHKVKGYTLKQIFSNFNHIDLCKVDIEGGEWDAIMEADNETLLKVSQYTIEFHDFLDPSLIKKTEECIKKLSNLGYKYESLGTNWKHGSPYYDVIFYKSC